MVDAGSILAAYIRGGTTIVGRHACAEHATVFTQLLLPETEGSQNRAREPSEDELQCAGTRHGCGKSTANLIIKFRHVSP